MNLFFINLIYSAKKLALKHLLYLSFLIHTLAAICLIEPAWADADGAETTTPLSAADKKSHHEEEHEENPVALTDTQLKTAGIELAQVGPASISEILSLYGTVEVNGEKIQRVGARFSGTVRSVNKKVGDTVREGEVLATIESNESLKTYSLTSALNGVVAERAINIGEQTNDKTAFVVIDLATVWVEVAVFPHDANKIRVGQKVRISNPPHDTNAVGEIIALALIGTHSNQSLNTRVLLQNAERKWTPGLFVNADVLLTKKAVPVAICNEALQDYEGKQVVFVKEKEGFKPRSVKLGRSDVEFTEVLSGISAGEIYASKNSFVIKAELGKGEAEHEH
ncbi:MAG TPA: efflux RND transporter periplasmic adaptor subunit [Cellvibrionaceae bacterium]